MACIWGHGGYLIGSGGVASVGCCADVHSVSRFCLQALGQARLQHRPPVLVGTCTVTHDLCAVTLKHNQQTGPTASQSVAAHQQADW